MTVLKYDEVIKKIAWPSLACYFHIFWKILRSVTFMQEFIAWAYPIQYLGLTNPGALSLPPGIFNVKKAQAGEN